MRQFAITTIFSLLIWSCNNQSTESGNTAIPDQIEEVSEQSVEGSNDENEWKYIEVNRDRFDSLMANICSTEDLEFLNLYPIIDSIASDKYENLILVDSLKAAAFKVTNWGRGNWMEGPRIVSFTMSNQQCECQVDKLYYSTEQEGKYKVTERIKCKDADR